MEKLKQRREDRKRKADDDKQKDPNDNIIVGNKADAQFEKMVRNKKGSLLNNPQQVVCN